MRYILFLLIFFFSCSDTHTLTDIDGNVYPVVKIGEQVWMTENLKVTRYRNGDTIPHIATSSEWSQARDGAFCSYDNDTSYIEDYGMLYNWYAVNDSRNIAPKGWHIPTAEEVATLVKSLRGDTLAGGLMKTSVPGYWLYPHTGADTASGFSALPGGYRYGQDGTFHTLGSNAYWWHTTGSYELFAWSSRFYSYFANISRDPQYMTYGFAVRCVKD
ncbi:MAG TPA: fibrobacter succinogenes major paralogous domain-containing protein [Chitinophaga sp.]|nr:fibrobacter succinogenes major paralogous domain-containing protein [Chitinophaga sp.]